MAGAFFASSFRQCGRLAWAVPYPEGVRAEHCIVMPIKHPGE